MLRWSITKSKSNGLRLVTVSGVYLAVLCVILEPVCFCLAMALLCCCSKSISLLYRTTGDLKWLCVHVWVCAVLLQSVYFSIIQDYESTWSDCVFMSGMCCVIAVSLFLYYTGLRETWSDCVFMFGMCCVIAVSLFLYYTGWWLYYWQPDE